MQRTGGVCGAYFTDVLLLCAFEASQVRLIYVDVILFDRTKDGYIELKLLKQLS